MNNRIKSPPSPSPSSLKMIYPWESDSFKITCYAIYQQALATGYNNDFETFENSLGTFFNSLSNISLYDGSYSITPIANIEQILRTAGKVLEQNVIIEKIPYYETSNDAGGYTVIIG